jgi:hypothetical protein
MEKIKNLPPSVTSLMIGLAGAVLYALNDLLQSGATLTPAVIVQSVMAAAVSFLISYGLGQYHLNQPIPGAANQADNEADKNN